MPQAKEGRGSRKEVRAVLITKQGGFATFLGGEGGAKEDGLLCTPRAGY